MSRDKSGGKPGKQQHPSTGDEAEVLPEAPERSASTSPASGPAGSGSSGATARRSSSGGARTAGRWTTGVLLLTAAGALVAGTSLVGTGSAGGAVDVPYAEVPAGPLTGVCPQPPRLLAGNTAGTDAEFSAESTSAKSVVSAVLLADAGNPLPAAELSKVSDGSVLKSIGGGTDSPLAGERTAGVVRGTPVSAAALLSAEPSGAQQVTAGATMTYTAADGDLAGLTAATCQAPANDLWLVGARTNVGAAAVLQLTNPSLTPADVDLELYGTAGPVEGPGSRGIAVGPGETKSVVLAGLAANQDSLAVRVRSSGGPVSAVISQNLLRGLTPGGVELIQPTAAPGPAQVVSGVRIQNPEATRKLAKEEGYASVTPSLQIAVPGASDAVVNVRVFGSNGEAALEGGGSYNAAAGTVTRLPLDTLPEGTYTLDISSDVAVAASAVFSRGSDAEKGTDIAVAPAGERLGSEHLAVLASGDSTLSFTAPEGASEVRLAAVTADGVLLAEKTVQLKAASTTTVNPGDLGGSAAAVLVSATGAPVYGAQIVTGGDTGISVVPLPRGTVGGSRVQVGVGY
ncbi:MULTISPECIES: DUF5719 family protein [Arthrobacter]|uniref:DUF5719 family protein n=1 Tax=Arthrobacter jinronghuae TaxID=2964609 RepID=A0ABT1NTL3_9MICC|nr:MULTISPECIES: DUF5719 family protein [Arthrobacter]MCQ1951028.1 DUF5719 family protein [Arthrobacter jinronghuae]MCQ1954341.1 DUF5719 family protein [Arthrobacter sp. zg-Y238]UWX79482.1 DUF5719 family protein [Arthrobacter jinronghuae]